MYARMHHETPIRSIDYLVPRVVQGDLPIKGR